MTVTDQAAEFSVFCPGVLDVLSIGKGDMRLLVGDSDVDREKAKTLITEMLAKGYTIFVETDKGPQRVKRFNPKRMTYLIVDVPEPTDDAKAATPAPKKARGAHKEVPVAGSRATAVGRTAGG